MALIVNFSGGDLSELLSFEQHELREKYRNA